MATVATSSSSPSASTRAAASNSSRARRLCPSRLRTFERLISMSAASTVSPAAVTRAIRAVVTLERLEVTARVSRQAPRLACEPTSTATGRSEAPWSRWRSRRAALIASSWRPRLPSASVRPASVRQASSNRPAARNSASAASISSSASSERPGAREQFGEEVAGVGVAVELGGEQLRPHAGGILLGTLAEQCDVEHPGLSAP